MKKVLFCLSLIISLLVLNTVPSFAMDLPISPEVIGGLGDLGYGLIGGASFDFTGSDYVINNYDNLSEQLRAEAAEQKAREFLIAYCIKRGIPIPNVGTDLPATDVKGFYKSNYFDASVRTNWNEYKLANDIASKDAALRFPIGPQAFADWTQYNAFWFEKFKDQFNIEEEVPELGEIPERFKATCNKIGSYLWYDPPNYVGYLNEGNYVYNLGSGTYPLTVDYPFSAVVGSSPTWYFTDVGTIFLHTNQDNSVSAIYDFPYKEVFTNSNGVKGNWTQSLYFDNMVNGYATQFRLNKLSLLEVDVNENHNTSFSNIDAAMSYIGTYFRNCNLYVDGTCWIYIAGSNPPIIPDFHDVIFSGDDDQYPAYDIVFPNTSDYEGTFDITSVFDALKEAIIGASDSDNTTTGTLTGDAVKDTYKDRAGEAVGEAAKTIDAVLDDSFPLQGTLNYPVIPPIPDVPISNAFAGTTILSQLIDACQQILPEPLTLAFWGIIFILFILGLIKILHK